MTPPTRYRIPADQRDALKAELRQRYEDGESIRDLADSTGLSYAAARTMLIESGATLRGRGGWNRLAEGRDRLAADLRHAYEQGATLRDLARGCGRSSFFVRTMLVESGATLRSRGEGRWRTKRANGGGR